MFTKEERKSLLNSLAKFIESDFEPIDVVNYIKSNYLAQYALRNYDCCDYSEELDYIDSHSDCDIESILGYSSIEFYDSEYGNSDPLPSFRLSSSDFEERLTMENLGEYDNILSHILYMVEDDE